jgi:hypothetical protein
MIFKTFRDMGSTKRSAHSRNAGATYSSGSIMSKPRHLVLLIADSLRYDSVYQGGDPRLPYAVTHGTQFLQARSAGCWTLPGTASLFTGLMPHEHGADAQSRGLRGDLPTLAEKLKALGYETHQVTANIATTEIFGLERGFDGMHRIWKTTPAHYQKIHELLVLVGKPRLRKKIISPEFITGKLSEDLEASKVWLQSTVRDVFNQSRQLLEDAERRGKSCFLFINLMETHFPYHVGDTFECISGGLLDQLREIASLYHLVNQTWLTTGNQPISPPMMDTLKERQRLAWLKLAPVLNSFLEELHQQHQATVVFGADHGDNFGEQGWAYHFSNVTDAGNRVPLFWLKAEESSSTSIATPVSSRDIWHGLLKEAGDPTEQTHLVDFPAQSYPIMQSCWYNNQGHTLPQYKYNQICFLEGGSRWLNRAGHWYMAPPTADNSTEAPFVRTPADYQPLEELEIAPERKHHLKRVLADFNAFSSRVMEKA